MATATERVETTLDAPIHPTNEQVGAEIRAWAGRRGVTQGALAEALCIHPATLNRKLKGSVAMSLDELTAICSRLGVPVSKVLQDAEANSRR